MKICDTYSNQYLTANPSNPYPAWCLPCWFNTPPPHNNNLNPYKSGTCQIHLFSSFAGLCWLHVLYISTQWCFERQKTFRWMHHVNGKFLNRLLVRSHILKTPIWQMADICLYPISMQREVLFGTILPKRGAARAAVDKTTYSLFQYINLFNYLAFDEVQYLAIPFVIATELEISPEMKNITNNAQRTKREEKKSLGSRPKY